MCLLVTGEEDRVVHVAKLIDPAKRDGGNIYRRFSDNGYGANSFPSTNS